MGFLLNGLALIAPRFAARHIKAQKQFTALRDYEGAQNTASTSGWHTHGLNADGEVLKAKTKLVERSRDLARNNPYARNAARAMAAHAVGKGIMPIPQQKTANETSKKQNELLTSTWNAFNKGCDLNLKNTFYGLQHNAFKAMYTDGEVFIRWFYGVKGDDGLLYCELLETDFLDASKTEKLDNGNHVVAGIEFDNRKKIVAYWMFEQHPHSDSIFSIFNRHQAIRVEAEFITHLYEAERPGQVRGLPWLSSVIVRLRNLDDYQNAELMRKKVAALFGIILSKKEGGEEDIDGVLSPAKVSNDKASLQVKPGMVHELEAGQEPHFITPQISDTSRYVKDELHAIALGLGLPYSMVSGDLSQANYSSLREGKLDFWQKLDIIQQFIMIPQLCDIAWHKLMMAHKRAGNLKFAVEAPNWATPARAWVDPWKDGKSLELLLGLGVKDVRQAIAERGDIPQDMIAQIKETIGILGEAGIPLPWADKTADQGWNNNSDAKGDKGLKDGDLKGDDDEKTDKDKTKQDADD